jgi:hypothetical protein
MGTSPSTSIPEENSFNNQFFTLQKEGERRSMLTNIMRHNEKQVQLELY